MAYRLGRIVENLKTLIKYEERKPENQKHIKCEKCGKEFTVGVFVSGLYNCSECKNPIRV
jgi:ribosomal protein L37AE/L43A